jgi:hypothetical protein
MTPLDEGSARRTDIYLTTNNSQETDIHAPDRIQTRNSSKRPAANPRLRALSHFCLARRVSEPQQDAVKE